MSDKFKKVLVFSDTHGNISNMMNIIEKSRPLHAVIHLGDVEGDENRIKTYLGKDVKTYFVRGNNDFFTDLPKDMEIDLGGHRCLLTHGHNYGVGMDAYRLSMEAQARNCDIAFFGHTHRPYFRNIDGVLCINPGSISYPRQANGKASFLLIEIDEKQELHFNESYFLN